MSSFEYIHNAAFERFRSESELASFDTRSLIYQCFFSLDMLINFITEHHYESSTEVERDLCKLFTIYIKGRFIFDLVALLPLRSLFTPILPSSRLLDLIKIIRLYVGFQLLDHKSNMK